jgi:hypothetical protein
MEPTIESPSTPPGGPSPERSRATWALIALGVLVAILVLVLVVMATNDDDDDDVATDDTTTSVAEPTTTEVDDTTTSSSTASTTTETTMAPGSVTDEEAATVAWPDPLAGAGFDDPTDAATEFATDVLGFDAPMVGDYQQGDSRSGEFEVRAVSDGPVTTIGVRQMSDDRFYVNFAASSEVELVMPTAGSAIDHPLQVEGWGRGFEGQVTIRVHDRVTGESLGEGTVTAGGAGEYEPFAGDISWDNPGGGWGVVVATVNGGEDGTTWAATALPVGFIGAD